LCKKCRHHLPAKVRRTKIDTVVWNLPKATEPQIDKPVTVKCWERSWLPIETSIIWVAGSTVNVVSPFEYSGSILIVVIFYTLFQIYTNIVLKIKANVPFSNIRYIIYRILYTPPNSVTFLGDHTRYQQRFLCNV
jgi:hypothetical protein